AGSCSTCALQSVDDAADYVNGSLRSRLQTVGCRPQARTGCGRLSVRPRNMAFFDRIFGKGKYAAQARTAELRGDLARAAELFGAAGQPEEAARIMILR